MVTRPDELTDTVLQGGYNNGYWPAIATALAQYRRGISSAALAQVYQQLGVTHENEFAVYNAVQEAIAVQADVAQIPQLHAMLAP